jgi:hypothetical protein
LGGDEILRQIYEKKLSQVYGRQFILFFVTGFGPKLGSKNNP